MVPCRWQEIACASWARLLLIDSAILAPAASVVCSAAVLPFAPFQNQSGDEHMMSFTKKVTVGLLGVLAVGLCVAEDLPYKEGTVSQVSSIKIKDGYFTGLLDVPEHQL
jgi:hypothetical protein